MAMLLSSCGIFRDVSKKVFRGSAKTEVKTDSTEKVSVKTLDKGSVITTDKGVTITESSTTKVTDRKGANWNVSVDMLALTNGQGITKEYAGMKLKMMLDSVGNVLNIDIQAPDEKVTETTNTKITENKDLTSNKQNNTEKDSTKQVAVQAQTNTSDKVNTGDTERTGKNAFWWMIAVVGGIAVAVWLVIRYFRRKI